MSLIRATRSREMSNICRAFVLLKLFSQAFEPLWPIDNKTNNKTVDALSLKGLDLPLNWIFADGG